MFTCNCGKTFEKQSSLNSHARFCKLYKKKEIKYVSNSIYKIDENLYKCECNKQFNNYQSLNGHFSHCKIHRGDNFKNRDNVSHFDGKRGWSKGLTKDTNESIKKQVETYKRRILTGEIIPSFKGKVHTIETKEKISNSNKGKNNGFVKTKWYEIYSPFIKETVSVQGTWELILANKLNSLNINWTRCNNLKINYNKDFLKKNYIPDFYLPDFDVYLEVKGFWFKSIDGRVDDRLKMKLVIEQNPNINLIILDSLEKINNFKI